VYLFSFFFLFLRARARTCGENPRREKHECKRDRKLRKPLGIILRCFVIAFSFSFSFLLPIVDRSEWFIFQTGTTPCPTLLTETYERRTVTIDINITAV
jgi:hypothetical protein